MDRSPKRRRSRQRTRAKFQHQLKHRRRQTNQIATRSRASSTYGGRRLFSNCTHIPISDLGSRIADFPISDFRSQIADSKEKESPESKHKALSTKTQIPISIPQSAFCNRLRFHRVHLNNFILEFFRHVYSECFRSRDSLPKHAGGIQLKVMKLGPRRDWRGRRRSMRQRYARQRRSDHHVYRVARRYFDYPWHALDQLTFRNVGAHAQIESRFLQQSIVDNAARVKRLAHLLQRYRHATRR